MNSVLTALTILVLDLIVFLHDITEPSDESRVLEREGGREEKILRERERRNQI